jgi:GT2 family glycosyltransferase
MIEVRSPNNTVRIAVVMACHNRRESTLRALEDLYRQQDDHIAIVTHLLDDGSRDGTSDAVRARFPQVRVLQGDGKRFWGGGMYQSMRSAGTTGYDFMLWLNDDVTLAPDAVGALIATYARIVQETGSALQVIVGSLINPLTGAVHYSGMRRTSRWHPTRLARVMPEPDRPVLCDTMNGNCVLVPSELVRRVGFIDPAYVQQLGDIDYGYRVRRAGAGLWVAPQSVGSCAYAHRPKAWRMPGLTLKERWRELDTPHGWPLASWIRFMWRYGGVPAVVAMLLSYAREIAMIPRKRA